MTPLPLASINAGAVSSFNPYYEINYNNFAVGAQGATGNNVLFYVLSRLAGGGSWGWWQNAINGLVGLNGGSLGLASSLWPSMVGAAPQTYIRITSFQFACGVRTGLAGAVPFACQVIVRPIGATSSSQYHICTFDPTTAAFGLQTCIPTGLSASRGFTFQTVGRTTTGWWGQWSRFFNTNQQSTLITALDSIAYNEYCLT